MVLMLPPVMPSIMRPANRTHSAPPIPKTKNPIAAPSRLTMSMGRRPYLSLRAPSTGAEKNMQMAYTDMSKVTTIAWSPGLVIYGCTKNGMTGVMMLNPIPIRNTEIRPNTRACLLTVGWLLCGLICDMISLLKRRYFVSLSTITYFCFLVNKLFSK